MKRSIFMFILMLLLCMFCVVALSACDDEPEIPVAHAHLWGEWKVTTPSTCSVAGLRTRVCTSCGESEEEVMPAAHNFGEWSIVTEPTCVTFGNKTHVCSICGTEVSTTIPKDNSHVYNLENTCTLCGHILIPTEGLNFSVNSSGYTVWGCSDTTITDLVIPVSYQGAPVTMVAYNAFQNCKELKTVYIPATVTSIEDGHGFSGAFSNTKISKVTFGVGSQLNMLGGYTFSHCANLVEIELPMGVTYISWGTFLNCSALTEIDLHEGITTIGSSAFKGCTRLQTVNLPDTLTTIEDHAFNSCAALRNVVIPSNVTSVSPTSFEGCTNLLTKHEGVHYVDTWAVGCDTDVSAIAIKEGTVGIADALCYDMQQLQSAVLPEGLKYIGDKAFKNCFALTSITLPEGLKYIGNRAFYNCSALTSITLPSSVTQIGERAFYQCLLLNTIYYNAISASFSYNDYPAPNSPQIFENAGNATNGITLYIGENVTSITRCLFTNVKVSSAVFAVTEGWKESGYSNGSHEVDFSDPDNAANRLRSGGPYTSWRRT